MGQREFARENETRNQRIDRVFTSADKSLFGEGPGQELKESDPESFERRLAVLSIASRDTQGTDEQKIKRAIAKLYPGQVAATQVPAQPVPPPANGKQRITPEQWAKGGLPRPTHRTDAVEPPGESKAEKSVRKMLAENASASPSGNGDGKEDFLD
jgi:hypothetical protein